MASARLCLAVLVVTGTLLDETSAFMKLFGKNNPRFRKVDLLEEALRAFATADGNVRFNLAPSYGTLNSKSLQQLDESLKVMVGGILELHLQNGSTWKHIRFVLDTSPLIVRQPQYSEQKLHRLTFKSVRFWGHGSNKSQREYRIQTWFSNLIGNVAILEDTDIDLDRIVNMVSKITVNMLGNLMTRKTKKLTLMDRGILRFPDISRPFFTLYRISLMGKCTYKTLLIHQTEESYIFGLYEKEIYYPDRDYIKSLSRDSVDQILDEVEDLFSVL